MFISSLLVLAAFLPMDIQTQSLPAYQEIQLQTTETTLELTTIPEIELQPTPTLATSLKKICQSSDECNGDQFCEKEDGQCTAQGSCSTKPQACTMEYAPVCGCDGKTYGNTCSAYSAGITVAYDGECKKLELIDTKLEVSAEPVLKLEEETEEGISPDLSQQIVPAEILETELVPENDFSAAAEKIKPVYDKLGKVISFTEETDDGKSLLHELQYNSLGQLDVEIITNKETGEKTKLEGLGDLISQVELQTDEDSLAYAATLIEKEDKQELQFELNEEQVTLPITGIKFQEEDGSSEAVIGDLAHKLKLSPPDFYRAIEAQAVEQENLIKDIKLVAKDDKPVYEVVEEDELKLFGIFPIKVDVELSVDAESNDILDVSYGFWGLLSVKPDYGLEIKVGPNLVITDVKFDKASYLATDEMKFTFTVANNGTKPATVYVHEDGHMGSNELRFGSGIIVDSKNDIHYGLWPGESDEYHLKWTAMLCNAPISIIVDSTNRLEETNENDNVWNYTTQCAPTNAPDLRAEILNNGIKRVGETYKVDYRIYNDGSVDAPQSASIIMEGDSFLTNRFIPGIKAGKYYAGSVTVTPRKCDRINMIADYGNIINETDENNNIGYEADFISTVCSKRPDLTVDHVWWIAGGYSMGEPVSGEQVWLEYKIRNNSHTNHDGGCVSTFKVDIYSGDKWIARRYLGHIGCWDNYAYSHPDYFIRRDQIYWTAECGVPLTITVDPLNEISETLENNNTWTKTFPCTLAPPIATPV